MNILFLCASVFTFRLVNAICSEPDCEKEIQLIIEELIKRKLYPTPFLVPEEVIVVDPVVKKSIPNNNELLVVLDDNQYINQNEEVKHLVDNEPIGYELKTIAKPLSVSKKISEPAIIIVNDDDTDHVMKNIEANKKHNYKIEVDYNNDDYDTLYSSETIPFVLDDNQSDNYNVPYVYDESAEFFKPISDSDSEEFVIVPDNTRRMKLTYNNPLSFNKQHSEQYEYAFNLNNKFDKFKQPFFSNKRLSPISQNLDTFYNPFNTIMHDHRKHYETQKKYPMKTNKQVYVEIGIQPRMGEKEEPKKVPKETETTVPKVISARMSEPLTDKNEDTATEQTTTKT